MPSATSGVVSGHGLDQLDSVLAEPSGPATGTPRFAPPDELEQIPVPAKQRGGLDQVKGIAPPLVEPGEQHHDYLVAVALDRPLDPAAKHDQLLPKEGILGDPLRPGPDSIVGSAREDVRAVPRGIHNAL